MLSSRMAVIGRETEESANRARRAIACSSLQLGTWRKRPFPPSIHLTTRLDSLKATYASDVVQGSWNSRQEIIRAVG